MNRSEFLNYSYNNKIIIQGLINKISSLQKRIEQLEKNSVNKQDENDISDNIISILATYDTKLEIMEEKLKKINTENNNSEQTSLENFF